MALNKMSAGQTFETLTQKELDVSLKNALREWMVDVAKGARPISIQAQGVADANGLVALGGATTLVGGTLGPEPAFWWAVTRLAVRIDGAPAAYTVYLNHASSQRVVRDVLADQNGYCSFGNNELLVRGGETLVIRGSALAANTAVTVSGAAIEMPQQLLWKWLAG